jgi:guanylate kinase
MPELGNLYVIAAPSGAGKTSLVKALVDGMPKITVSISHTTREKRPNEVDGVNYHFVDKTAFEKMIQREDFLEHATIFGNFYGTCRNWVNDTLQKGIDVILEIDWQGHQQIKRIFPNAIGIFILPPSLDELRERLERRNQDHAETIKQRLDDAQDTLSHVYEFNYVVVNDDFVSALHDLKTIVEAGRLLQKQQLSKYQHLMNDLLADIG